MCRRSRPLNLHTAASCPRTKFQVDDKLSEFWHVVKIPAKSWLLFWQWQSTVFYFKRRRVYRADTNVWSTPKILPNFGLYWQKFDSRNHWISSNTRCTSAGRKLNIVAVSSIQFRADLLGFRLRVHVHRSWVATILPLYTVTYTYVS